MPILEKSKIKEKVKHGEITILSLDTNVFSRSQNNLESGIIGYLSQFADSEVDVVLSDVVVAELRSHIRSTATSAHRLLKQSIKEIQKAKFSNEESHRDNILDILKSEEPNDLAERRVSNFLASTKAKVVRADEFLPVDGLLLSYFQFTPPFENNEKRKHEFPDAMALGSLESFAQKVQKMILVVSNDKGWKKYCQNSKWLVYEDNLGVAMGYFQSLQSFAESALYERKEDFKESLDNELSEHVESMFVDARVESSKYTVLCEDCYVYYCGFNYDWEPALTLIKHDEEEKKYAFNVYISVEVSVSATLDFFLAGDKEDFYVNSIDVSNNFSQFGSVTIEASGNLNGSLSIDSVYVNEVDEKFNFGDITPES